MRPVMTKIHNARYQMELRGGGDVWRIAGEAEGHPDVSLGNTVFPSTPTFFDEINDTFVTASGREYHIVSYQWKKEEFVKQILKDIKNQGFEVH